MTASVRQATFMEKQTKRTWSLCSTRARSNPVSSDTNMRCSKKASGVMDQSVWPYCCHSWDGTNLVMIILYSAHHVQRPLIRPRPDCTCRRSLVQAHAQPSVQSNRALLPCDHLQRAEDAAVIHRRLVSTNIFVHGQPLNL
jgi:hypothetical protein